MNILQVSIFDISGGAEKVAWDLHHAYLELGHRALLVVGTKRGDAPAVVGLKPVRGRVYRKRDYGCQDRVGQALNNVQISRKGLCHKKSSICSTPVHWVAR